MLEPPQFEAWYRVQMKIVKGPSAKAPSIRECSKAFERYRTGLGDFY
jgi:hypothetical protein